MDSKTTEHGRGNGESDLASGDKQLPIAAKKTALRELQNENRIIAPSSTKGLSSFKDRNPTGDPIKVAGTKRPLPPPPSMDLSVSPPRNLSPSGNAAANGQLVYVRRKSETETSKSGTGDQAYISPNHLQSASVSIPHESLKQQSQIKDPKIVPYPAFASIPFTSPIGLSTKPSIPFPVGMSGMKTGYPTELKYGSVASASSPMENSTMMKSLHWEERYKKLQKLLCDLDQADHKDYFQGMQLVQIVLHEITQSCLDEDFVTYSF